MKSKTEIKTLLSFWKLWNCQYSVSAPDQVDVNLRHHKTQHRDTRGGNIVIPSAVVPIWSPDMPNPNTKMTQEVPKSFFEYPPWILTSRPRQLLLNFSWKKRLKNYSKLFGFVSASTVRCNNDFFPTLSNLKNVKLLKQATGNSVLVNWGIGFFIVQSGDWNKN